MHKPAASFFLLAFRVGICWNELSHWKSPFLEWGGLLYRSGGPIRIIGRISLLWLANQGGHNFLQKFCSILESRLLRTYLVLQVSTKPWSWVLWSYHHRCRCCCSAPWLEEASKCASWKDRSYFLYLFWNWDGRAWFTVPLFVRIVKLHLQPLLPCLFSNSSQTPSVWDNEERM